MAECPQSQYGRFFLKQRKSRASDRIPGADRPVVASRYIFYVTRALEMFVIGPVSKIYFLFEVTGYVLRGCDSILQRGRFEPLSYDTVQALIEYLPRLSVRSVIKSKKREPNPLPRPSFVCGCIVKAQIYN